MYSPESISYLQDRIGFGSNPIAVNVDPANQVGSSGRLLTSFHKLADLKQIYNTTTEVNVSGIDFNLYLQELKKQAALKVLTEVFNKHSLYKPTYDYSSIILERPELFDDALGFSLAIAVIEQQIAVERSNNEQRKASEVFNKLKLEIEGVKDAYGNVISRGLFSSYYYAHKNASKIIFKTDKFIIDSPKVR
jgi:actin-related protein